MKGKEKIIGKDVSRNSFGNWRGRVILIAFGVLPIPLFVLLLLSTPPCYEGFSYSEGRCANSILQEPCNPSKNNAYACTKRGSWLTPIKNIKYNYDNL